MNQTRKVQANSRRRFQEVERMSAQAEEIETLTSSPSRDSLESVDGDWSAPTDTDCQQPNKGKTERVCCIALPLLAQRLGHLRERNMFTDVVFIVNGGDTKIEAHRVILAAASETFQQLLYYDKKAVVEGGKYAFYEDDFSESAIEVFVKAMYTNEIPICLTLMLALEVFYVAKKYGVIFLEDKVLEHIRQLLTVSNVFEALHLSTSAFELAYLAPICWKIIEEQTSAVLEYHLEDLDAHKFGKVLERDRLAVGEVELFQIAVRWASNVCKSHGMKTTAKNKRQFLESLMKHFRFTTMTQAEFTDVIVPSRILDAKEIQQIQSTFAKWVDPKILAALPYKTIPRVNISQRQDCEEIVATLPKYNSSPILNSRHRGGGDELPKIQSDSAVITASLSTKSCGKKGANAVKGKPRRTAATRNKSRS